VQKYGSFSTVQGLGASFSATSAKSGIKKGVEISTPFFA
jgi:hypothetical protein